MEHKKNTKAGKVIQIIGSVVDVEFPEGARLPEIYNALKIEGPNGKVLLETVKHLDMEKIRAISLQSTDGLERGLDVEDTGKQISVPVGQEVLGNLFNVFGE
ncbi:MAG: F0F1 ATP synthase subunit beta, partial [Patescibacteria group bacterium]